MPMHGWSNVAHGQDKNDGARGHPDNEQKHKK
jgi:hypothetical protein